MGQIKAIEFDDAGDLEFVTVRLTADEAAFIAKFTGNQSTASARDVIPAFGDEASNSLYEALDGNVFNRLFDDGVNEYIRERK